MDKITDILLAQRGSNYAIALSNLGGSAAEIESKFQKALDDGLYQADNILAFGRTPEQWAADEAYSEIRREIITRMMQAIPRDQMVTLLNAMAAFQSDPILELLPGERFSNYALANEWNRANPNVYPIAINPNFLP